MNKKYRTITAVINQNGSNFSNNIQFIDDAKNVFPSVKESEKFFGYYPCLLKNGKINEHLSTDFFAQSVDGVEADIFSGEEGDAMIAFPRRGIKITTKDNKIFISVTDNPADSNFTYYAHKRKEKHVNVFYTGVFPGCVENEKLRSLSGKNQTTDISLSDFRKYAHNNGEGYEIGTFYQKLFQQIIFIFSYGSLNCYKHTGAGIFHRHLEKTGETNDYGMNYKNHCSYNHMKLFGIEDLYGGFAEYIDGIQTDAKNNFRTSTGDFNNTGNNYKIHGKAPLGNKTITMQGTSELGFIPKTMELKNNIDPNYFTSESIAYTNFNASFDWESGLFLLTMDKNCFYAEPLIGARLSYY